MLRNIFSCKMTAKIRMTDCRIKGALLLCFEMDCCSVGNFVNFKKY